MRPIAVGHSAAYLDAGHGALELSFERDLIAGTVGTGEPEPDRDRTAVERFAESHAGGADPLALELGEDHASHRLVHVLQQLLVEGQQRDRRLADPPPVEPAHDEPGAVPVPGARIQVADTGLGIDEQDLPKLFKPFRQLDTGLSRAAACQCRNPAHSQRRSPPAFAGFPHSRQTRLWCAA